MVFSNTVENASAAPETINVQVDASSTLPADWTVLFYQTDGLTPLLDTNGDAIHDVGILPPGGTYTVTVRIYIPLTAVPGDNGGAGYNNVVRSSLASAPGVFNLTTNIIASIVTVSQVWDPFRKDQTAPALPQTGDTISYTLEFGNQSSVSLTNVVIIDELSAELTNIRNWTDLLIADINNPLLTVPAVATYDPLPPHKMIWNIPSVPANFTGRVSFDATIANGLPPVTEILNDFVIRSDQTQEMRRSNLVFAAVGVPQVLTIQKTSNEKNAEVGDYILYTLDLANSGLTPVTAAVVTDTLPRGFRYIPGTAKMDDAPFEPAVTPDGKVLTWNVGLLPPGGTRKIKYACQITPDAMRGNGRNQAELAVTYPLGTRVSVFAENQVHVTEGPFANLSIIFGKVFLDQNDNRLQDAAEPGIGGVRLYLEDGTHVTTDREGKYHFEGVKPGMHVIRLDQTTLAPDLLPATIDSSNAANPLSRFVDLKFGTPHKANFRVLTAARQEPAETAGASGTPLRLQSPAVTGLGDGGGTRITVLADRPVRTLWVHDPGTGTVNLQFPGAELGPETAAGSREYAEDLNIEEIRLHDDREGNQAKVQIRLRKRVGGYPSVSIEEQANGLLVQVGAAADAPPALPTAAATGTEPEPVAQVQTRFLAPADGTAFISRGRVNVEVSCHLAAAFDLFVNDQLVDKAQIGRKKFRVRERRADYEYVGVALEPGANRLRFTARPPGKSADESAEITVHRSAAPASVRVTVTPEKPVADGKTEPVLAVSLLDAAGIATANGTVLTVVVDRGDILSRDLQQVEPGHQVQVRDGRALVRLSAAAQPEVRELKIIAGELEYSEKLRFHPDLRDWIVNGVVALTGQRQAATDETLNADTHRQTELDDRVAVFAKGRLPFDTLMTVSYDNTKDEDGRKLFQEDDPLKYYPIYGDETRQEYEAESRDKLYLKLERDDGFLMWGDFKTGLDQAKLTAYDRSFTGAQAQARTDWFDFDAFFSRNDQAQVKTEIQGQGISGYYNLPDRDLIENSEQVTIETRDRWHPERVLKTQSMQRYSDYSMDYDRGRLLFKRPVPSKDQNLDPVFIVVRYEVDGRKAGNYNVYGGRAAVHDPSRRFELGATSIVEQALPENYTLQGADLTLRLQPWLTLRGEYAKSRTVNGLRDDAHLVELEATHERAKFRLWHERIGKNFENLSMRGSSAGIQSFGLEGKFKLTDEWGFEDQLYSRRDTAAGTTSDVILHDVLYKQERFDLCLGGGYVHEREGLGGGTTDRRQSPILRLGGGIDLNSRWRLEAMHQHAFGDTTSEQPTRSELDVSYKINDRTKAYLGGERRKSLLGGYEDSLVIGIDRQINRSLKGFQKFTVTGAADGRRVASGSGLDLSLPINSELTLDATAELSRTVIGTRATGLGKDDFWAFTIGASYRPLGGNYTAVSRYEVRGSEDNLAHLAEIGGTLRLNPDHSLFGRNIFTYDQSRQPGTPNSWTLDLLTGWAYRPVANDRLMILSDVEVKTESGTAEADEARLQRYLFSGELHYQPAAHTWLEAKYACKLARASFARGDLFSDVKAVRLQHDLSQRLYAAAGARMLSVYESGTHDLGYGVELGLNLRKDARIAVGYNFSGFRDRDFDRNDTWERGAYISFFWKFDESLLGILRRLEGKTD